MIIYIYFDYIYIHSPYIIVPNMVLPFKKNARRFCRCFRGARRGQYGLGSFRPLDVRPSWNGMKVELPPFIGI